MLNMEEVLSSQTKLSLIKNEREERGLRQKIEKIVLAKSVYVSNSNHERNVFLKHHSRLLLAQAEVCKHRSVIAQRRKRASRGSTERKSSQLILPKITDSLRKSTDWESGFQSPNEHHQPENVDSAKDSPRSSSMSSYGDRETSVNPVVAEDLECTKLTETGETNSIPEEELTTRIFDSEAKAVSKSPCAEPVFVTELGLIEEEDSNLVSPEKDHTVSIPIKKINFAQTKRRTQSKPSLSPIQDEQEDQESKGRLKAENKESNSVNTQTEYIKGHPDIDDDKNAPALTEPEREITWPTIDPAVVLSNTEREVNLSSIEMDDDVESEKEDDSVNDYIELVRISNRVSESKSVEDDKSLRSDIGSGLEKPHQETVPVKKRAFKNKVSKKHQNLFTKQKSRHSAAFMVSAPLLNQPRKSRVCRRYEQAMIPLAFNIDFLARILQKKGSRNKSDEDEDGIDEYSHHQSLNNKKKTKRKAQMSPVRPRVIWTQEKWRTLPDCRYLRLPPLVQIGNVL